MSIDEKIKHYTELKERAIANRNKELGRYEVLMKRLKDEFQHEKVEDLDAEIAAETQALAIKREELAAKMEEFENEHLEKLAAAAK